MFDFNSRMLETIQEGTGRRVIENQNVLEELCSSLTFVDSLHAFYAQAYINETEMIRFEGLKMESGKLPLYWEWKFLGVYVYNVANKAAMPDVEIDPVVMYQMLNSLEKMITAHTGLPQYSRNNRIRIRQGMYDEQNKTHMFVDTFYEVTDEKSFVNQVTIEKQEIFETLIPTALLHEAEIKAQEEALALAKEREERLLGF